MNNETITIVSGLPRSGTSMMMKMLEAGGLEPLTDNIRTADEDNPKGYFEFERVKQIEHDKAWLGQTIARGDEADRAVLSLIAPGGRLVGPEVIVAEDEPRLRIGERHVAVFTSAVCRARRVRDPFRLAPPRR